MRPRGYLLASTLVLLVALAGQLPAAADAGATDQPESWGVQAVPLPLTSVSSATPAGVAAAISADLADPALGPGIAAEVLDAQTGTVLFRSGTAPSQEPASSLKILTGVTVLTALGIDSVLTTRVVRDPDGTVVLVGAGDPALTAQAGETGASLEVLAGLTALSLSMDSKDGATPAVRVAYDDALFSGPSTVPSWPQGALDDCLVYPVHALMVRPAESAACVPDPDPAATAGAQFARLLAATGIGVVGSPERRVAAAGAQELAAARSAPISALVENALLQSDNTAMEMLTHLAGAKLAGEASFVGGAKATAEVMKQLAVAAPDLSLVDASGLSREDRVAPATTAAALRAVTSNQTPQLWPVASGLPVAGFDGTLADRFTAPAARGGRGDVRAKTGTLTGVSALAGQVASTDKQLLLFVFVTNTATDTTAARAALDRAAAALADCGCR